MGEGERRELGRDTGVACEHSPIDQAPTRYDAMVSGGAGTAPASRAHRRSPARRL